MNYIELINNFWQANKEHCFTGNETALYFYLLHTCNSLGWKNPFKHSNGHITGLLGMSEKTLHSSKNKLWQAGLIEYSSGNGRRELSAYTIKGVNITTFREQTGNPFGGGYGNLSGANTPDNIKLNKTKLNSSKVDVDAAASPPVEKEKLPPSDSKKNKKPPGSAPPPKTEEEPVHQQFVDVYYKWYSELVGTEPRVLEADYAALKKIRRYLVNTKKGDAVRALASWQYILDNWGKLEDFLQKQLRPADIDRNMTNILAQLRNTHQKVTTHAGNQQNHTRQPSAETAEQAAARYKQYNPNKPASAAG